MREQIIGGVAFDIPNVRQTALHVMKWSGCDSSLSQAEVEKHLQETVISKVESGDITSSKQYIVPNMQAYYVVEDYENIRKDNPEMDHQYAVNFFVRVGHRQDR